VKTLEKKMAKDNQFWRDIRMRKTWTKCWHMP